MTSSSFRCPSSSTRRGRRDNARGGARKGGDGLRPSDLVNRRLCAQRISATAFTRPADVVAWLGAVQAQDFLGALWAVGLRLTDAREREVERALADRSVVRTWPLRGTLHLVAAADVRWIVELLAPRVVAAAAGRFRALGLDDETMARARRAVVRRLQSGGPVTRRSLYDALERAGVASSGQRGIHVLWRLAHEGVLCFGPREGKQQTFVLLDAWLPPSTRLRRDEALAELARRYFTSHGPATLADFAWWSGLKAADARLAVHLAGERLEQERIGESVHWWGGAGDRPSRTGSRAYLLPAFDEFVVGYADRAAIVDRAGMRRVNTGGGILNPTIVAGGRVVGTWKRRITRAGVVFSPAPFVALREPESRAVATAMKRYARFLELEARANASPARG